MDHKDQHTSNSRPSGVDRPISEEPRHDPDPDQEDPGAGEKEDSTQAEALLEEGVNINSEDNAARNAHRPHELAEEDVVLDDENILPTGIQTGQTGRGSYSTDTSTGAGHYADHRAGTFGVESVAQPGNDEDVEPDPIDTQIGK